jgi:hypothetical protein
MQPLLLAVRQHGLSHLFYKEKNSHLNPNNTGVLD